MISSEGDKQLNTIDQFNNQLSNGSFKVNVNVKLRYNNLDNLEEVDELEASNRSLIQNIEPIKTIVNNRESMGKHNSMNNSNSKTLLSSTPIKSLSTRKNLNNYESTLSTTPIKSSPPNDHLKNEIGDHVEQNFDDLIESYESLSPPSISSESSSLLSTLSNCSKNSQLTDQLYNCDAELNPVVQVCVRLRPMNRFETNNKIIQKVVEINENDSTLNFRDRKDNNRIRYKFKFDHLFYSKYNRTLDENQQEIYSKIGKPYIQNVLEGNDLCYFAYGQTGSGKSYTIMGDESTPGLVFRFAEQLFKIAELNENKNLNQLMNQHDVTDRSSDFDQSNSTQMRNFNSTDSILLAAKRQIYEASQKYGFNDVIDGLMPENSFKIQDQNTSADRTKDKILRFDENIKCYKDDHIYHEKLFASDSEFSSLESCKNFSVDDLSIDHNLSSMDKENLRVLKNILTRFGNQKENLKIDFSFKISFYEIYSECIYDLLEPSEERVKSKIREHPTNGPYVENLTMKTISTMKELKLFYELGNKRRSRGSTSSNDQSSRSHGNFSIYITQTHHYEPINTTDNQSPSQKSRTTKLHSKISFVDLAGSERALMNDNLTDERIKEGNSINKSLLMLGKVITKLAWINKYVKKKNSEFEVVKTTNNPLFYVPYRNSL